MSLAKKQYSDFHKLKMEKCVANFGKIKGWLIPTSKKHLWSSFWNFKTKEKCGFKNL
jgi:hypothetical protein